MAKVLLAGCGSIGIQLGKQLMASGYEVVGLRRSSVDPGFPCLQADLTQPLPAHLLPDDIDYVVHTGTPTERSDEGYRAGYVQAVSHLLGALHLPNLKRFLFVSSTAVYHQDDGSVIDETSPTTPDGYNGIRVLEAETLLADSGVPYTAVRFGGIYGPGRNWLIRRVQNGAEVQASPLKYTNRIHQDDCVGMLLFLIQLAEAGHPLDSIYIGVDSDPADEATVCRWMATELNAPTPVAITAPASAATPAPQNKRCSNARIKALGYHFLYPDFRDGYRAIFSSQ